MNERMKSIGLWAAALTAALTWVGLEKVAQAQSGGGQTRITLTGSISFPAAKGKATFRARPNERQLQVQVENVPALVGATLDVYLGGNSVGQITVGAGGAGALNVNSLTLPPSVTGTSVEVKNGGTTVVSGSF